MLALGAGVYEELLFRVLLVSAIAFLARRVFRWRPVVATVLAVVLSALIFAAFHYIGPYGDPLRVDSFVFRFIGGLAFSVLYVTRGFGVTAWTHSLYDLLVLVA
jgi:membrane protease YdiL (CAAX protease family)